MMEVEDSKPRDSERERKRDRSRSRERKHKRHRSRSRERVNGVDEEEEEAEKAKIPKKVPLSLEELLAKKKAEEEALSKVLLVQSPVRNIEELMLYIWN
ncbi:hypothetical protein KUTeg_008223 [Tegillarca granosa]|uniref:Uncharacterized protein n=1 Tax=Tegillarca granosa TaxID=220873 RepID=A0ABQ9FCT1_TEGGR|nr:hypothetical protein KUTeg_008223 [Tegillarca granosa]